LFLRLLFILLLLVVVAVMASRLQRDDTHDPLDPSSLAVAGVLSTPAVWDKYRTWLVAERQMRSRTVATYRRTLWSFWGSIDPRPWHRATPRDLTRLLNTDVRVGQRRGRPLAPNTRLNYAAAVVCFYRWAAAQQLVATDRMVGFTLPRGGQPLPRGIDPAALRQVLLAAEPDPRLYLMVWLMYGAGLRAAEVAGLRVEDCYLGEHGYVHVVDGKGGRQRTIPLYPELRAALVRWTAGLPQAGPLFPSPVRHGEPVGYKTVSAALSGLLGSLGIGETGHALRHAFAQELLAACGEEHLLTVSRLLGHSSTQVTERIYLLGYRGQPERVVLKLPDPRTRKLTREVNP
jgi:integrase/recombinase XerC